MTGLCRAAGVAALLAIGALRTTLVAQDTRTGHGGIERHHGATPSRGLEAAAAYVAAGSAGIGWWV